MDIYIDYAKTRQQVSILSDKLKDLEELILKEMKNLSVPVRNEYGVYGTVERTITKLSENAIKKQLKIRDEIKKITEPLNLKIKSIEEEDIKKGTAIQERVVGLRFIENKK
jgi:hypothetical protein